MTEVHENGGSAQEWSDPKLRILLPMKAIEIAEVASAVFDWAREKGFAGHDPHDFLTSPLLASVKSPLVRLLALQFGRRFPLDLRSFLQVPRAENPKALALFMLGLIRGRERIRMDWQEDAAALGERLIQSMHSEGGWGYPFPWQSRTHFLPANTPNIVTTSFAGMALIELSQFAMKSNTREAIERAAELIATRLASGTAGRVAFGYAEDDPQIVFNASLLGAEFLLRAGVLLGRNEYLDLSHRAAEFVAANQQLDGSWQYGLESSQSWIDSFHTGFVVVSMKTIAHATRDDVLMKSAQRGFQYYRNNFVRPDGAICYFPDRSYPIDAHALGQAMVTLSEFGDHGTARQVASWSCKHMLSQHGFFFYQKHRFFTNRIPYMRWSNAWMFRGLCEVLAHE